MPRAAVATAPAARLLLAAAAAAAPWGAAAASPSPADEFIARELGGKDFLWGTATAAYQVEGAWDKGGRQTSIWDIFSQIPGNVYGNETGNEADDFYHRYREDIQRVKDYGFNAFRFSISWPRIFPVGADGVHRPNPEGVEFYKNVTRELLSNGITPLVTLYHWDLPSDLDWLNDTVIGEFVKYADFVWATFPEVKYWATFNEPWTFCNHGYGLGIFAPGVKSTYDKYICGHNVLLAHSAAVDLYRKKYLLKDHGNVGIVLNYDWTWPYDPASAADVKAAQCSHDFWLGWFADPIYLNGDYPPCMKERLGDNLPKFTTEQRIALKGSVIGPYLLNTYSGRYAKWDDTQVEGISGTFTGIDGKSIGPVADSSWLHVVPMAIRRHLEYVNQRYFPNGIIVTENGCDVPGENTMPLAQAVNDTFRVNFYRSYLEKVAEAVNQSEVPVKGYVAWSLEDNFEWADGYHFRFGITYVDYATQERYPKASAKWFTSVISLAQTGGVVEVQGVRRPARAWIWLLLAGIAVPFVALGVAYARSGPGKGYRQTRGLRSKSGEDGAGTADGDEEDAAPFQSRGAPLLQRDQQQQQQQQYLQQEPLQQQQQQLQPQFIAPTAFGPPAFSTPATYNAAVGPQLYMPIPTSAPLGNMPTVTHATPMYQQPMPMEPLQRAG